jgi:general secretion pathway protein M
MKDWINSLQPRERLTIAVCAVITVIALLYLLVWAPIQESRAQLAVNVEAQRETLAWMQQASAQVRQTRLHNPAAVAVNDTRSLLSIVDSSAKQASVRDPIQRMEPEGDDGVKLSMEDADFDATIQWLGALKRSYNVDVVSASITPSGAPGQVDTRLSLQRP